MGLLSHAGTIEFANPKSDVVDALLKAIPMSGMTVETADSESGDVVAKSVMSITSWGERIRMSVRENTDGRTQVHVRSASKGGFFAQGVTDLGRNRKNVEKILQRTTELLAGKPVHVSSSQLPSRLEQLRELKEKGLISESEYDTKRADILAEI